MPVEVAPVLISAASSACVLSLHPPFLSGSLLPLFGLCPQLVSSAAFLGRSGTYLGCGPQLVSSACVLYAFLLRFIYVCRYAGIWVYGKIGRYTGTKAFMYIGMQTYRYIGTQPETAWSPAS